jgi:chromosome segregation ATPase
LTRGTPPGGDAPRDANENRAAGREEPERAAGSDGADGAVGSRILELEREIAEVVQEESSIVDQLEAERSRRAALEHELSNARDRASQLLLAEAAHVRDATLAEAEREAAEITHAAFEQAKRTIAEAEDESKAVIERGRARLHSLEADAKERIADLEKRERDLTQRIAHTQRLYKDLQDTLKLVAETSIAQLADAQRSAGHVNLNDPSTTP